jgi:hypothetical protein
LKLCILIQTCDSYEFLWEGLDLSWKHCWDWKELDFPIFALTEEKDFVSEKIQTLKFGMQGSPPKNFSTRLISALRYLSDDYDYVLYSQDDFWPMFPVRSRTFQEAIQFMASREVSCLHMNEYNRWYNYRLNLTSSRIDGMPVYEFETGSPFYYNHQAAIWKIEDLLKIQQEGEAPYENECKGTERSWSLKTRNCFLNFSWYKPAFVNLKGVLSPVAEEFVKDWKWKQQWEQNM